MFSKQQLQTRIHPWRKSQAGNLHCPDDRQGIAACPIWSAPCRCWL